MPLLYKRFWGLFCYSKTGDFSKKWWFREYNQIHYLLFSYYDNELYEKTRDIAAAGKFE